MTWVPDLRPVKSRVVPDGTERALRTMVAQEALDLEAAAAPPDPEKVQAVPRCSIAARASAGFGAAVGAGAGAAETIALSARRPEAIERS